MHPVAGDLPLSTLELRNMILAGIVRKEAGPHRLHVIIEKKR
jgi:hypothetical protein